MSNLEQLQHDCNGKILTKQDLPAVMILDLIKTYHEFFLKTETLTCAQNAVGHPRTGQKVFTKLYQSLQYMAM